MQIMLYAIPVFFLLIGVELVFARLSRTDLYAFPDAVTNISTGIIQQVTGAICKTAVFGLYLYLFENQRLATVPDNWATWLALFVGVDFFYYWFHRSTHEVSLFWGAHIVHHQSEEYNLSVALRQSATSVFLSQLFYLPLAVMGFSPAAFLLMSTFQTLYQFWIHTRAIGKLNPVFEYVFNTPSHHRVHHGQNPKYLDRNHGGTLILFDRWFGTFQKEEEEPTYGVTVPLRSWNPVWANFEYFVWLGRRVFSARSFSDAFSMLFKRPGWLPGYLGGPIKAKKPAGFEKFSTKIGSKLAAYVLANLVVVILATVFFLIKTGKSHDPTAAENLLLVGWICLSTASLGGLMEGKSWARFVEIGRWAWLVGWLAVAILINN